MTRGRFVVVEGGDASGKSTQVAHVAALLRARGDDVVTTFEPGATAIGAVLRDVLLHRDEPIAPVAEAFLMAADRAQHLVEIIEPALARGDWVVSDRYLPSSLVYQGVVRGIGVDAIRAMNALAVAGAAPDLVIVLDVPDAVARRRRVGAPDRIEAEPDGFHAEVIQAYRDLAGTNGWVVVDASGDPAQVSDLVTAALRPLLAG